MTSSTFAWRSLALAAAVFAAQTAQAGLTVYTDKTAFLAALGTSGTDSFNDLSLSSTPSPLSRSAGAFAYKTRAEFADGTADSFYNAGSAADVWLSHNDGSSSVFFYDLAGANAIGGNFFAADLQGAFLAGQTLTLTAVDDSGSSSITLSSPTVGTFRGFVSTGSLLSLQVSATQPTTGAVWTASNDLVLGSTAPVPEPATYGMMFAGLLVLGALARRRKNEG